MQALAAGLGLARHRLRDTPYPAPGGDGGFIVPEEWGKAGEEAGVFVRPDEDLMAKLIAQRMREQDEALRRSATPSGLIPWAPIPSLPQLGSDEKAEMFLWIEDEDDSVQVTAEEVPGKNETVHTIFRDIYGAYVRTRVTYPDGSTKWFRI